MSSILSALTYRLTPPLKIYMCIILYLLFNIFIYIIIRGTIWYLP
nr:MAG TPA: hypothetical protein [Caudoviricetes sp.]